MTRLCILSIPSFLQSDETAFCKTWDHSEAKLRWIFFYHYDIFLLLSFHRDICQGQLPCLINSLFIIQWLGTFKLLFPTTLSDLRDPQWGKAGSPLPRLLLAGCAAGRSGWLGSQKRWCAGPPCPKFYHYEMVLINFNMSDPADLHSPVLFSKCLAALALQCSQTWVGRLELIAYHFRFTHFFYRMRRPDLRSSRVHRRVKRRFFKAPESIIKTSNSAMIFILLSFFPSVWSLCASSVLADVSRTPSTGRTRESAPAHGSTCAPANSPCNQTSCCRFYTVKEINGEDTRWM